MPKAAYPDVEVQFVTLSSNEIDERSARLRELLLRGALRFVRDQTGRERRIEEPAAAVLKSVDLVSE
jgi:hypothetical protein